MARDWSQTTSVLIAGLVGRTARPGGRPQTAADLGYHAGLLSLAAMKGASEDELIAHCRAVAEVIPLFGFYLQTAVGGIALSADFWRRFAEIEQVVAIKIAPFDRYRTLDVDPWRRRGCAPRIACASILATTTISYSIS